MMAVRTRLRQSCLRIASAPFVFAAELSLTVPKYFGNADCGKFVKRDAFAAAWK